MPGPTPAALSERPSRALLAILLASTFGSPPTASGGGAPHAGDGAAVTSYVHRLSTSPRYQPESEPNGSFATGTVLGLGSGVLATGAIAPEGDVDYWRFFAIEGYSLDAALVTSGNLASPGDSLMRLIGPDGTTILEADDDDGSFDASSSTIAGFVFPATGEYALRIHEFGGDNLILPYELYVTLRAGSPDPEQEPNDSTATAQNLPVSGWISGSHDPAGDLDLFRVDLVAGDTVVLILDLDPERDGVGWDGRVKLLPFGDADNLALAADQPGAGSLSNPPSESVPITIKQGGTFYVGVDAADGGAGGPALTYRLAVSVWGLTPEGIDCAFYSSNDTPKALGAGPGLTTSTVVVPGHPRIADLDVWVDLDHTYMTDLDLQLRSPAGNDNPLISDIGSFGSQQRLDLWIDDEAAIPSSYIVTRNLAVKPDPPARLSWFDGEDAGGTWTLALYDDEAGKGGTLQSWSLRICQPLPTVPYCPPQTTPRRLAFDFEGGASDFTVASGEWEVGLPALAAGPGLAAFTGCASGTSCWKTDLDGLYNDLTVHELVSPSFDLAGWVGNLEIGWSHRYQLEESWFDRYSVELTEPDGGSAAPLFEWEDGPMTSSVGSPAQSIGASAGWARVERTVSLFDFTASEAVVRFRLTADPFTQFGGVALDDFELVGCDGGPEIFASGFEPGDEEWSATSG